ncbi:hypothetical protein AJ79_04784 [Helicocarpus griseus UAMH5409]|uniref:Uncharacterized protein n=1 Tax=Helicocarpus griseus UAMH5409 TaxID=1447875 RepID=A0A2B7XIT8_9EURO|nr:hypothetical protein AJ79_04784 [Helicocarpus griseus UAMH5409]
MHFEKALALFSFCSGALSFEIRVYPRPDCFGTGSEVINVWDNTCRDSNVPDTESFEVVTYGAKRQKAAAYSDGMCTPTNDWTDWWADGGDNAFKKGNCINLGYTANAFGSRSA